LSIVDETLTQLFQRFLVWTFLGLLQLDVLTSGDLALLFDALPSGVLTHLMAVGERVVLACLAEEVLHDVSVSC
jgi:hypothetical protein